MTWKDFLKYSKYIAVFYGIAFMMVVCGIWAPNVGWKFLYTGLAFGMAAAIANISLAMYFNNHRTVMTFEKKKYVEETLAGSGKELVLPSDSILVELEEIMKQKAYEAIQKQRGY